MPVIKGKVSKYFARYFANRENRRIFAIHFFRGVAQLASASALGAEGRRFESYYPDKFFSYICGEYEVPCIPDP